MSTCKRVRSKQALEKTENVDQSKRNTRSKTVDESEFNRRFEVAISQMYGRDKDGHFKITSM